MTDILRAWERLARLAGRWPPRSGPAGRWLVALLLAPALLAGAGIGVAAPGPRLALAVAALDAAGTPWSAAADQAWLRGRAAARSAARDRAAVRRVARDRGAALPPAGLPLPGADVAIPAQALAAYHVAARWAAGYAPGCGLPWTVLAGIGKVESDHGRSLGAAARVDPRGDVTPPILGPRLDGHAGTAAIPDSDRGRLDGDTRWDRAVGPMQFLPSTWRSVGRDGNGDGVADPNNLVDAAVTAAAYLCLDAGGSFADPAAAHRAIFGYNHSWPYVTTVLAWAARYGAAGAAVGRGAPLGAGAATRPATTRRPAPPGTRPPATRPPATRPPGTRPPGTRPPPTSGPGTSTSSTAPPASTAPPTSHCTPPTSTTAPPGSSTSTSTTTTTTTTLPPGTTTTAPPPCR